MPFADVNGLSIDYRESGSGDPVVLLHGALSDHRIWSVHREALGSSYRTIAYSSRYHGESSVAPPDDPHAVSDQVDDLIALLGELDAAPAHLVGNSFGGLICILAALREPDLVRSLVLLEPLTLPFLTGVPPNPIRLLRLGARHPTTALAIMLFGARGLGPTQAAFKRGDLEHGLACFTRAVLGAHGVEGMPPDRREQARDNLEIFATQLTRGTFPVVTRDDVRALAKPTLILNGDQSPKVMWHMSDRLHDLLKHAERVTISQASHDMHVDNPSDVTAAILEFLERQPDA